MLDVDKPEGTTEAFKNFTASLNQILLVAEGFTNGNVGY
jgi:hypothetical protein